MTRSSHRSTLPLLLAVLFVVGVFVLPSAQWVAAQGKADPLSASLAKLQRTASYQFAGDIEQITTPAATIANVGQTSHSDTLHIEGHSDQRQQLLELQLWAQNGSVLQDQDSMSVRVERGVSSVRTGTGPWEQRESFSDGLAPNGDVLAYLQAARDVVSQPAETRAGLTFTRLTFRLDGPVFAAYMREQLQQRMLAKGAPANMQLNTSYYEGMQGNGELWVGQDGMPIRQQLHLRFPEQNNESLSATMTITFSNISRMEGLTSVLDQLTTRLPALPQIVGLLIVLMLGSLIMRFSASRRLQKTLAVTMIVSITLGPLLSDLKIHSFMTAQAAQAAEASSEREQAQQLREARAAVSTSGFDPHANPLSAAKPNPDQQGSGAMPARALNATVDDGSDTDQDGLTNFQEERVGTDPNYADSDEDGVPDGIEVKGVSFAGQTWYLNANDTDTNRDGIADGQEWDRNNDSIPDDTDADGLPDAFDSDNDNDGVPDAKDLAPFTRLTTSFSDATPFGLSLKNVTPNIPTYIDFQLRPVNPNHLWFALNVLDWPRDTAGQVRDIDNKSYADNARAEGRSPAANESSGDMKLIPMLEIRMPDGGNNLPALRDLVPYNITLNNFTTNGSTKIAYVPLNMLTDEKTGMRVAFSGRMRYLPGGSWPAAHQVRLAWVLQVLNDMQCDPTDAEAVKQGCARDGYIHNVPQVVQTYYDDWTLTGLNVKEDHGASMAIAYEDPAVDPNLKDEPALTALAGGLDNAFLSGRDEDTNGQRDVNLTEIVRRFNHATNAGVSEDQRWAIPNILNVERKEYSTFDQALASTVMTETVRILNTQFSPRWQNDKTIKPLLLYAQESRTRAIGLDGIALNAGYVTQAASTLTVDMKPAGQAATPVITSARMQWTPYCSVAAASASWLSCDTETWWNELEKRSPQTAIVPGDDPNNTNLAAGRILAMQLFSSQMSQGISRVVQQDTTLISANYSKKSDPEYASLTRTLLGIGNTAVKKISNELITIRFVNNTPLLEHLGTVYKTITSPQFKLDALVKVAKVLSYMQQNRLATTGIALAGAAVIVAVGSIVFLNFLGDQYGPKVGLGGKIAFKILVGGITTYLSLISPVRSILSWASTLKSAGLNSAWLLTTGSDILGTTKAAGVIGTVISVAVTWGFFIYSMVSNQVSAFSPAFNKALAETIASTIYAVLLFVLAASVIGTIIVAIIGLIDFILTAVCELGVDALRILDGACFTLGNAAIKGLAWNIYNYSPMIDTSRADLMVTGAPDVQLTNPAKGFVAGNPIAVTLPVTTTIVHKDPNPNDGLLIYPYMWLYSADNLRTSTFKYSLTQAPGPAISVERNQMTNVWQNVREDHKYLLSPMYRGQANTTPPAMTNIVLAAGLNQKIPMTLNMGYAVPAYECWGLIILGVCYTRNLADSSSIDMSALQYDIFPASLDEFMTLTQKGSSGQGLAWSDAFPALQDADGDSLRAVWYSGVDPNDSKPDADNDGLSDAYELDRRTSSLAYNPSACDTDSDGLSDKQEAESGTDPANPDSDRDGLTDGQELWHQRYDPATCAATPTWEGGWDLSINGNNPFTQHVSSNPLAADSDGDGINDAAEKQLAASANNLDSDNRPYNPNVANLSPITLTAEIDDGDGIVGPNQTFGYLTTATTNVALGSSPLSVGLPAGLGNTTLSSNLAFTATAPETLSQPNNLTVSGAAASSTQNIVSTLTGKPSAGGGDIVVSSSFPVVIDADPPVSALTSLQNDQYVQGGLPGQPITLIIAGSASDSRAGMARVEVSVNNGPWQLATGTVSWSYALALDDGVFVIRTRATDNVGNVETPTAGTRVFADGFKPLVNFPAAVNIPGIPKRTITGQWVVPVTVSISDPQLGRFGGNGTLANGSGLLEQALELRLRRTDDDTTINSWQALTHTGGDLWSTSYQLPASVADPTGRYYVEVHAADLIGNQGQSDSDMVLDASAPVVTLSSQDSQRKSIQDSVTMTGLITDVNSPVGINRLDARITPFDQVAPWADAVLHLLLNEAAESQYFVDSSGYANHAACSQALTCPDTGVAGRSDQGLLFFGAADPLQVADQPSLDFGPSESFSVQGWVKTTRGNNVILHKGSGQQRYRLELLASGLASFTLWNAGTPTLVSGGSDLRDNQWHYVVGTLDRASGQARLYVDGVERGSAAVSGDFSSSNALEIGGQLQVPQALPLFQGNLDEVAIFGHALSAREVQALYAAADRQWSPATLAQQGAGVKNTTWSFTIPNNLEGLYQIDLRSKDMLGNQAVTPKVWRGVIDTQAPRIVLTAQPTGAIYFDANSNAYRAEVKYVCAAQDQYLDESSLKCPGTNLPPFVRSFDNDPILQKLFPDLTVRSGLGTSYTQWELLNQTSKTAQACDVYGHCATATAQLNITTPTPGAPLAIVVSPATQSYVASTGALDVGVAVEADQPLKEVTLTLDGQLVNTTSFTQVEAVKRKQYSVAVNVSGEGKHTLVVRATDWTGRVQTTSYPVEFTLDIQVPTVSIDSTPRTVATSYGPGTDILRFSGAASDSIGLASVQMSINGSAFTDVTFGNGLWFTAQHVSNPEGKTLSVKVRATDLAGRVTETTQSIPVDITTSNPPDTSITAQPTNPSTVNSASFSFSGTPGERGIAGYECQLDQSDYAPCFGQQSYANLSAGNHSFMVRAIDSQGYVDPSPASFSWMIRAAQVSLYLPVVGR